MPENPPSPSTDPWTFYSNSLTSMLSKMDKKAILQYLHDSSLTIPHPNPSSLKINELRSVVTEEVEKTMQNPQAGRAMTK